MYVVGGKLAWEWDYKTVFYLIITNNIESSKKKKNNKKEIVDRSEKKDHSFEDLLVPTVIHQNSVATSHLLLYPLLSLI